jgi:dTDP-4-amino-4,6-dideoxygalactose transaminase
VRIPLAKPEIGPAEREAAARVLSGTTLACGPEVAEFERRFAAYTGAAGAVALNSGTSGLIAALAALGVGAGDEVVIPGFTFVATANAVLHRGAVPVLADVDPVTMGLTAATVAEALSERTRAVIVVHLFGRPTPMDALIELARQRGLAIVEDACEAIGSSSAGVAVGSRGDAGVFGFYPNKPMTTGEGGIVISRNQDLLDRCRAIANQGRSDAAWVSAAVPGFSFRMSEIAAALGTAQLGSLDRRIQRLSSVAALYNERFADSALTQPELEIADAVRSWFTYPVLLDAGIDRARVQTELAASGIASATYFPLLQQIPGLEQALRISGGQRVSENLATRLLSLPLWGGMGDAEVDEVVAAMSSALVAAS